MSSSTATRAHWSSRWAFILVTAGSAIGLGNIWKFPYMTGTNGGSAFVLVYLACIIGIGLPLLMAEIMLGRRGQENPADTMRLLAREARVSPWWQAVGFIGIFGALFILSFYSVVAGWILDYTVLAARGFGQFAKEDFGPLFAGLLANPVKLIGWHSAFMLLNFVVVAGGITGGI